MANALPQHSLLIRDPRIYDVIKKPFKIAEAFQYYFINIPKKVYDMNDFRVKHKSNKTDRTQFTTKRWAKSFCLN